MAVQEKTILNWDQPSFILREDTTCAFVESQNNEKGLTSKVMDLGKGVFTGLKLRFISKDINEPIGDSFEKSQCPFAKVFIANHQMNVTKEIPVMKEILRPHRDNQNNFYVNQEDNPVIQLLEAIHPGKKIDKNDFFLTCDQEHSKIYRRVITNFLGTGQIKNEYSEKINKQINKELFAYEKDAEAGRETNITLGTYRYTSAVISDLFLGHPGPYEDICDAINCLLRFSSRRLTGINVKENELNQARNIISEAVELVKKLNYTPFIQEMQKEPIFQEKPLRWDLMIFGIFAAGQETTSTLIMFLVWALANNTEVQEKLREELYSGKEIHEMDYLNNVIREGLRLYPPFGHVSRRLLKNAHLETRRNDEVIEERCVFADEYVTVSPYYAGRDPKIWGEDVLQFRPERWQDHSLDVPTLPFGFGQNRCIGSRLAWREAELFLIALVKKFKITTSLPFDSVKMIQQQTSRPSRDILVNFQKV